jgi:hypothetical protein
MALFLVRRSYGPARDPNRSRRAQDGWNEHAAFMDALTERGTVLLGGPVGNDLDSGDAMLVVAAEDEDAVRAALTPDPWHDTVLVIKGVERWTLWLRAPALADRVCNDH